MWKTLFSFVNYLHQLNNYDKLEINSELTSEIDNGHLELRKEERRWLMEQTFSENIFEVFDSSEYSSKESTKDSTEDSPKHSIEESRESFLDSVLNKFGFVIVMEDMNGNVFGGFIRKRIVSWKMNFSLVCE